MARECYVFILASCQNEEAAVLVNDAQIFHLTLYLVTVSSSSTVYRHYRADGH